MQPRNGIPMLSRLFATAVLTWTGAALPLRAAEPATVTLGLKDTRKPVQLHPGGTLVVRLGVQMGTGYSWKATLPEGGVLVQEGEPKVESGPGKSRPGAWETQVFTFAAKAAGKGDLRFAYARSFEPGQKPMRTVKYKIAVAEPKK